jgi:ketosteroid isomerase-like protein
MQSGLNFALAIFLCIPTLAISVDTLKTQEKPLTSEQRQIVDTVTRVFEAVRTDDVAKFKAVTVPDFYIFDGGVRFNGEDVMALFKQLHAAGKRYEWRVTEPDVHIIVDTAWIAYVNKGSITDSSGTVDPQWLESAFLQKQEGTWKIVFMHSTRVSKPVQQNQPK